MTMSDQSAVLLFGWALLIAPPIFHVLFEGKIVSYDWAILIAVMCFLASIILKHVEKE